VGRLTVERMLGENFRKVKGESNKAIYVGIAGIAVALGIGGGLYLYLQHNSEESALRAKQQQGLLQKMDEQVKAQPAQEAQMQAQIMQLGQQLKAAQVENRKELSQLAQNANPTPPPVGTQSAGQPSPSAAAYDQQLQVALQQFQNNDLAASMKSCAGLIKLDGNRWEAYALAGRALSGANKQAEAKNYFVKAEQLAPADTKPQIHQMLDQLGQAPS
jgi:hypothetical protein